MSIISFGSFDPVAFQSGTASLKGISSMCAAISWAQRCANTSASSSELDARRFAPCSPVLEHSPQAYRLVMDERPISFTFMPPQQ